MPVIEARLLQPVQPRTHQSFLNQLMESIGIVLNTIAANMRTEGLLKQSPAPDLGTARVTAGKS